LVRLATTDAGYPSQYYCQTKLADRKGQPFKNKVLSLRKKMETKEERNFSLKFLNGKHASKENVRKKTGFSY
jgi:hypothetical protein